MFFSHIPVTEHHEAIYQALPPLYVLHLDQEIITNYGSKPFAKSGDVYYDSQSQGWVLPATGQSYFELQFETQQKLDHPYLLTFNLVEDLPEKARFTIYVNDQLVEFPSFHDKRQISFDIQGLLNEKGNNTIRIINNASSVPVSFSEILVAVSFNPFEKIR